MATGVASSGGTYLHRMDGGVAMNKRERRRPRLYWPSKARRMQTPCACNAGTEYVADGHGARLRCPKCHRDIAAVHVPGKEWSW